MDFLRKLPQDLRKLIAGGLMAVLALVFLGVWGSVMSSRLTALNSLPSGPKTASSPSSVPAGSAPQTSPYASNPPPSPAEGIAGTFSGLERLFEPAENKRLGQERGLFRGFFATIGEAVSGAAEFLYLKLSRYVTPNL